jgi:2-polyprenyl-3-methyl-5-hydroxy-6-metoxy-1,4-benzoquinol methylase
MTGDRAHSKPDGYWDRAGEQGYSQAMYRSSDVESHVRGRLWRIAVDVADTLGVPADGHVIDVGCGDGAFANRLLATHYRAVDGFDVSQAAIRRAQAEAPHNATYRAANLVAFDYDSLPRYDAAFLIGFLHHVKRATLDIVRAMARRTDKMIVLEPNGNNLLRKAIEFTPSYRDAGEDSFRTKELMAIFAAAGWRIETWRRLNIFSNLTPSPIYRWLEPLEPYIEANRFLSALCTADLYGLRRA